MNADLTLPEDWTGIGALKSGASDPGDGANILPFSGVFDGGGHLLTVPEGGLPLFGYVRGAVIRNLNVFGSRIAADGLVANYTVDYGTGGEYSGAASATAAFDNVTLKTGSATLRSGFIGGLAGPGSSNEYSQTSLQNVVSFTNCTVESGVTIGYDGAQSGVGSFAGQLNGSLSGCVSSAAVSGADNVGGLVGFKSTSMGDLSITDCQFHGSVTASGRCAGGILGSGYDHYTAPNARCAVIENCTCDGTVAGGECVGGILGGEGGVWQAWDNGIGYIRSNSFTGTVSGTDMVGGVIGYYRSLNRYTVIENNFYAAGCGAEKGIGSVLYVDSSIYADGKTRPKGWVDGVYCFDSSEDDIGRIKYDLNRDSQYYNIARADHNRTDDPLGADADNLTYSTEPAEPTAVKLEISGSYKTEYEIGDALDLTGIVFTVTWSDGTVTNPALGEVEISAFDSSEAGSKTLTVKYGAASAFITLSVAPKSTKIKVYVTVYGHYVHDSDTDGQVHGLSMGGLSAWITDEEWEADTAETVWDVLQRAFAAHGITVQYNTSSGTVYISGLTKDGVTISEFTTGAKSGWMYTLNGHHPLLGVSQQYLKDGDRILFHYTDDYTQEEGSEGYDQDDKEAAAAEALIDAIGSPVTLASLPRIEAARKAYDALDYAQKSKVGNYEKLTQAEETIEELRQAEDGNKAKAVADLIDAIGDGDTAGVESARRAYDALTDAQKALVTNYEKLLEAERKIEEDKASAADKEAAKAVSDQIDGMKTPVTLSDEAAVKAAREAYDKLTELQKRFVTNYGKLTDAEKQLSELKATEEDRRAAEQVDKLINAVHSPVQREDEAAIRAAREAYDALTDTQKGLVAGYGKLAAAERDLALLIATAEDRAAAEKVEQLISALPSPVTLSDEAAIKAAREAYDKLTDVQKQLVTNSGALAAAERQLAELKATEKDREAAALVESMIAAIRMPVEPENEAAIRAAREAYDALTDLQKALVTNAARLTKAENDLARLLNAAKGRDYYTATGDYIESLGDLDRNSDWMALGMIRSGREINVRTFVDSVTEYVRDSINEKEQLHRARSTDNSRTILVLTALGYDVTDVAGHNLLMGLTDLDFVKKQGINGPIWALIALDSNGYEIPENPEAADQTTREKILRFLLEQQLPDGGWALSGTMSDSDITGMCLQALAPYYDRDPQVKAAVDEALKTLSRMQNADGTFSAFGGDGGLIPTSESISQIIVALSALGIDADKDPRFIKNGNSALDALCGFYVEGGGFRHLADGKLDGMATEQAYYALTAYFRMVDGKTSLYDMRDVGTVNHIKTAEPTPAPAEPEQTPETEEEDIALAVTAAETKEEEKAGLSMLLWAIPLVGLSGTAAYAADKAIKKRRRAKH